MGVSQGFGGVSTAAAACEEEGGPTPFGPTSKGHLGFPSRPNRVRVRVLWLLRCRCARCCHSPCAAPPPGQHPEHPEGCIYSS